jgi:hypothetical protein
MLLRRRHHMLAVAIIAGALIQPVALVTSATALKAIMAILIFPVDAKVCTASLSCLA